MIHGRSAKLDMNPRSKNRSRLLTGSSESEENSLENRVERLEARIEQMQAEINGIAGMPPEHFYGAIKSTGTKRPGPDARMNETELLLRRDNLVHWLEQHWPNIVSPLLAAKNPRQVGSVLRAVAPARYARPEWQRDFIGHPAALFSFLHSENFRRKSPKRTAIDALCSANLEKRARAANRLPTRQIADAMAGVPRVKWRTSLDRCSRTPCTTRVGSEAASHYRTQFGILPETS